MSTVNMEAMMTELTAQEQLAKLRIDRIRELQEQIKSRRDAASAFRKGAMDLAPFLPDIQDSLSQRGKYMDAEADALQATLDALLAEPLEGSPQEGDNDGEPPSRGYQSEPASGGYQLNGEPRSEQGNWKGEA